MKRYSPLLLCALLAACANPPPANNTARVAPVTAPARPASPPPAPANAISLQHLPAHAVLNRLTWGADSSSTQLYASLGSQVWLQQQLQAAPAQLPPTLQSKVENMRISRTPLLELVRETDKLREQGDDKKEYQQQLRQLAQEAAQRNLLRAVYAPQQLQEQMLWFWLNHFNIFQGKHNLRVMLGDYEENAIRPHTLGNFKELLWAVSTHPAMLRYLDNEHNAVQRINENLARELLELHTMGVGSGYSQQDVQELARILTGVGINSGDSPQFQKQQLAQAYVRKGLFEFNPRRHDFGDKTLLGRHIRGQGLMELRQAIEMLAGHPATARHLSFKLAQYFVADQPPPALVENMAQTWLRSDGDIPSVLRTMLASPEFAASLGRKFKDPQHYLLANLRLAYDPAQGRLLSNPEPALNWLQQMGQSQFGRQTPDGYPQTEAAWASSAQLLQRFDIAKLLAQDRPQLQSGNKSHALNLQTSPLVQNLLRGFSPDSLQTLAQSSSVQQWHTLFFASPEMMRR